MVRIYSTNQQANRGKMIWLMTLAQPPYVGVAFTRKTNSAIDFIAMYL